MKIHAYAIVPLAPEPTNPSDFRVLAEKVFPETRARLARRNARAWVRRMRHTWLEALAPNQERFQVWLHDGDRKLLEVIEHESGEEFHAPGTITGRDTLREMKVVLPWG